MCVGEGECVCVSIYIRWYKVSLPIGLHPAVIELNLLVSQNEWNYFRRLHNLACYLIDILES